MEKDYSSSVLVACEESQAVTLALRALGIRAFSCDTEECSGGSPNWHIKDDVRNHLAYPWRAVVAFPPCTDLTSTGARHFKEKQENGTQQKSIEFFLLFTKLDHIPFVAIENPVGIMSSIYRKPDQYIQPWQFGHPVSKKTCLWLKGLPKLIPTNIVEKGVDVVFKSGKRMGEWYYNTSKLPLKDRAFARSKTFPGIAGAMAQQWFKELSNV